MVLIVDDCEDIGRAVVVSLKLDGIESHCVMSATEALRLMAERLPTVIVLDDFMPDMNGLEFLRHLRTDPNYRHLPVIFHSAGDGTTHRDAAEKLGIAAWVQKGANTWPVMLAHIHAQLATVHPPVAPDSAGN